VHQSLHALVRALLQDAPEDSFGGLALSPERGQRVKDQGDTRCGELVNALALPMPPPPPSSPPPLSPGESLEASSGGQSTASAVGIAFGVIAVLSATAVGGFFLYRRFGGPGRGASGTRNNPYATNVYADRKNGDKMAHQVAIDMHVHSKLKPNQA